MVNKINKPKRYHRKPSYVAPRQRPVPDAQQTAPEADIQEPYVLELISGSVPEGLRKLADRFEGGQHMSCTIVRGPEVFSVGISDPAMALHRAVFNLNFGLARIMLPVAMEIYEEVLSD